MLDDVYQHKIELAELAIADHNKHLPPQEIRDWSKLYAKIREFGGTSAEALREMSWEDLQECGVPRLLAKRIANQIFRSDQKPTTVTNDEADSLSFIELFALYDPTGEQNPSVTKRLKEESNGQKCVVFNSNGTVDLEESTNLLRELKDGLPERQDIGIRPVYRVGETPNKYFEENFLFPGEVLRAGRCTHTNRKLNDISLEARQIIYLAITATKELQCQTVDDAHRILDMLNCDDPVDKAQARYTKAAIMLQDMQNLGNAPPLKIAKEPKAVCKHPIIGAVSGWTNDPFYGKTGNIRT